MLDAGTKLLPFGEMTLTVEPSQFLWGGYRFIRFIPVGEFVVRGLSNRYRQAGVGAALAAEVEAVGSDAAAEIARKRIPPRIKIPVTAFVRFAEPLRALTEGKIQGQIELYASDQATTVQVGDRDVPLELEATAALAYTLEGAPIWDFEIAGFRLADPAKILGDGLVMMHPYRKDVCRSFSSRHGIKPGALGGNDQRADARFQRGRPFPVLVFPVQHRAADSLLRHAAAPCAPYRDS